MEWVNLQIDTVFEIKRVEMANDDSLYEITKGDPITVQYSGGNADIFVSGEEVETVKPSEVKDALISWMTDDGDLAVSGYGKHSGRKFWQLPDALQTEVLKLAGMA